MENTAILIGTLRLTGVITEREADRLARELPGQYVPTEWHEFVRQVEQIIGRRMLNENRK